MIQLQAENKMRFLSHDHIPFQNVRYKNNSKSIEHYRERSYRLEKIKITRNRGGQKSSVPYAIFQNEVRTNTKGKIWQLLEASNMIPADAFPRTSSVAKRQSNVHRTLVLLNNKKRKKREGIHYPTLDIAAAVANQSTVVVSTSLQSRHSARSLTFLKAE